MPDWKLGKPGSGRGGKFNKEDHDGHLMGFVGIEDRPMQKTAFGDADAVLAAWTICFDDGFVLPDLMHWGTAVVPALLEGATESEIVVARLGKGTPRPGQSPPWLLFDPTDEDLVQAAEWLDKHAARMPSGALVIEPPAPAGADEDF